MADSTPNLTRVFYDGAKTVSATWDLMDGVANFLIGVIKQGGTVVKSNTAFGVSGTVTLDAPLTTDDYQVAIAANDGQQGPWGNRLIVVVGTVGNLTARYDGTAVTASWTLPGPTNQALLSVIDDKGKQVAQQTFEGTIGRLAIATPLGDGAKLSINARFGGSVGPPLALPLITAAPAVQAILYDPNPAKPQIQVTFAAAGPGGSLPLVTLFAEGAPVSTTTGAGTQVTIPLSQPLDAATIWSVALAWTAGGATGPAGRAIDVIVAPPAIRSTELRADGTVELAWRTSLGPPYATGVQVVLSAPNETARTGAVAATDAGSFTPKPPLTPGVTYAATLAALHGPSQGPASAPVNLATTQTSIATLAYDGKVVALTWTDANPSGTAGCLAEFLEGASVIAAQRMDKGRGTIAVALDPLGTYTAQLRWLSDRGIGPPGPATAVIAGAPALQGVAALGADVNLTWLPSPDPGGVITGYEAVFTAPGTQQTVALGATSPKQITIPTGLDALTPIELAVRAKGTAVNGPLSGSSPVLRDAPGISEASVVDGSLALAWTPAIGALEGYAVTLGVGGTNTTSFFADTAATLSLGTVSPGVAYTVAVEARSGVASGGATPLPLVVSAAALGAPSFDGASLSIAVTAPASPSPAPTGYRVELVRNGEVIRRADLAPPQGPLVFALSSPSDAAAPYTVRVRARAGAALGPAAEAPVVLATPTLVRVEVDAQIVGIVAMQALAGQTLTLQAALVVDGSVGTPQAADTTGAVSFALPGSGKTWAIVARAVGGGGSTGPWSAPLAIPVAAPTVSSAAYDGTALHVEWSGDPGSEYLVTVASAGQEIAHARATGLAARLPFAAAISAGADVVVRQVSGVALGPLQRTPLVLAGCAATAVTAAAQDSVTVTWAPPANAPQPTTVVPVLQWEGSAQQLADQPVATNSFAVSLAGIPAGAAIGVRARAGAALGPVGNLVPVVLGRPTNIAVTWDAETVSVAWSLPKDPRIDGALVTLTPGQGQSVVNRVTGTQWSAALTAAAGSGGSVSVAAAAGSGTGAASDPAAIIVAPPALTVLGWGATLAASWTAPALPTTVDGYLVEVSDADGRVIVSAEVGGTSTALAVPPSAAQGRTLTVAARAGGSLGPRLKPVGVPTAGPALLGVTQDPLSGAATVSWAAVGGTTTGYLLQLYRDGRPSGTPIAAAATATSLALPSNPGAFEALEVALAVQGTDNSVATIGPAGPRLRVPTQPVVIGDVDFDGAAVRVTWRPVPHASGYALAVVAQGLSSPAGHDVAGAGETARRFAVKLGDPTLPYEVVVQPMYSASIGIAARAPLFAPGLYVRPAAALPDVLPKTRIVRASSLALTPDVITAYLPELGKLDPHTGLGIGLTGLPIAPPQAGTNDIPFTLAAAPSSAAPLNYLLTIANGALRFDAGRATLADAYRQLLKTAETNGAAPRGVLAIQQAICRLMPQTFDETLYYAYGLSAANGCIDLRPGMVLRVGFSGFDLTAISNAPVWSTGYVGGAVVDYDVGDLVAPNNGGWLVGFDAFVNWLVSHQALIVPPPQRTTSSPGTDIAETGGADAADLSFTAFTQPFYRLLIPGTLQAATSPAVSRTGQQFTIAAAPSWTLIDAATPAPGGGVDVAYFRGRAVVRACIRVQVEAAEYTVPIGTTVGNLLDRLARRPPSAAVALRGLRLERAPGPAILDPANGFRADAMTRVHLAWNGIVSGTSDAADALSLPLLHGDRISFGESP